MCVSPERAFRVVMMCALDVLDRNVQQLDLGKCAFVLPDDSLFAQLQLVEA